MSVAGFDVGNDTSCVAIARKRGIDVLLNKESKRETPSVVNFGEKMRFLGTDGSAKQGLQPQNTVHQLKRLLGKKFSDPSVQADIAKLPYSVSAAPDGSCLVTVMFQNEQVTFTPEQLMAMVLVDLKKISEAETGVPPVDCVLTVPVFYTEAQRYAMINAAQIAGLNCLRLLNENTATALAYGIFKTDLPETEPVHVAFVDVGHSATQVSIVSLRKAGLQVRCHAWDSNLGGRDLDELLFDHFAAIFKEPPTRINIPSNKKASFKLRVAIEKLKKILSANAEAPLNIECIMDDKDIRGSLTRDQLETLAEPMGVRLKVVLEKALAESGLTADQLSSVEVVGSSTRVPFIARAVEQVFGKVPSRTMNAKECVSRGAALQCAMLSPVFKVREFDVVDAVPYAVDFTWDKEGKPTSQRVFERNSPFPSAKMLTFLRAQPFSIAAVAPETGDKIGEYQVGPFTVPAGAETAKLKVKVRMNLHGLVQVENVQAVEEEDVTSTGSATSAATATAASDADAKMDDAAAAAGAEAANGAAANGGAAPMETDAAAGAAKEEAGKKKKVKKADVPFAPQGVAGLSQKQLDDFFEKEGQMQAQDKLQEETADRKNAVEAYVYKLRNGVSGGALEPFVNPADKDSILSTLQACEDWLYEDGEDVSKSVYVAKLEEIQGLGAPVELRAHEDEVRPAAVSALQSAAEGYLNWCSSADSRYAHITAEERAPLAAEAQAAINWIGEKVSLQQSLKKWEPPVLLSTDCRKKQDVLDRLAKPIISKPAPKPAAPPAPAAPAAPAAEEGPGPMESEGASEGAPPAGEQPAAAPEEEMKA